MFNFGTFLRKNAISFVLKEIERKRRYFVARNFSKYFFKKSPFFPKVQSFRNNKIYFRIPEVVPIILITYIQFWSNSKAINQLFTTSC